MTATAPTDFEVSLDATSSYTKQVKITPTADKITDKVISMRSAVSAKGTVSGKVVLTSAGAKKHPGSGSRCNQ